MKVFKFGGASLQHADAIKQFIEIIRAHQKENIVLVVSAMGKTTRGLENILDHTLNNQPNEAAIEAIYAYHSDMIDQLLSGHYKKQASAYLTHWKKQLTNDLSAINEANIDRYYSRIIAWGELLSSFIIHTCLQEKAIDCLWLDARKFIQTQQSFKIAPINWKATTRLIKTHLMPHAKTHRLMLTQGFIASNESGDTTTLGKEGSDFTGAILATILKAESLTIWKDVPGIMSADPKLFPAAVQFTQLAYETMAKMAFYGAQVLHPQTIKPLAENNIPLYVKPFANWQASGTSVQNSHNMPQHPIYTVKTDLCLVQISSKDFIFLATQHMAYIFHHLAKLIMPVYVIKRSAYTLMIGLNNDPIQLAKLDKLLNKKYLLTYHSAVSLLTVMHQAETLPNKYLQGKTILLEQQGKDLYQVVFTTDIVQ